jgi:hypothetical protein
MMQVNRLRYSMRTGRWRYGNTSPGPSMATTAGRRLESGGSSVNG